MRDFDKTAEPSGVDDLELSEHEQAGEPRFVVQEHHATALHWDFRLERNGVLVSWAVPKGIPPDPRVNHLAVHTEDHPLSYYDYEGKIPKGEYGGGHVGLWDRGTYETEKWSDREVMVVLHGSRVSGKYVLFQTGGKNWMIHRMDPADDPTRELMPKTVAPARLVKVDVAPPDAHRFEVAWGGRRVAVGVDGGRVTAWDEAEKVVKVNLGLFGRAIGALPIVFEGELVGPTLFLSDVVWLDGHWTRSLPFAERRRVLDGLALDGPSWKTNPLYHDPDLLLTAARDQGLPGVIARTDAQVWTLELPLVATS